MTFAFFTSVFLIPFIGMSMIEVYSRELRKLLNTDFSLSLSKILSLTFGYISWAQILTIAIYLIYPNNYFDIKEPHTLFPVIASALSLCFIARLINRKFGIKSGEQFILTVTSSAIVVIIVKIIITINSWSATINPNLPFFTQMFINIFKSAIDYDLIIIEIAAYYFIFTFSGSFICALIGEIFLKSIIIPENHSLAEIFKNYGKVFVPYTPKEAHTFLKKTLSCQYLKSIKLITTSLDIFYYETELNSLNIDDFKVIAPYIEQSNSRFTNLLNRNILSDYIDKYNKRQNYLKKLHFNKKLQWRIAGSDNISTFIVNDNELLITLKGSDYERIFYSNDIYVVLHFVNLFDRYFNNLITYDEFVKEKIIKEFS